MNVYLFGFQKRKNSTKTPALNTGTLFTCQLKEDTSVLNPVLLLNEHSTGMPSPFTPSYFTFAYIDRFARYYFVTDWRYINGLWECYLVEDVLASFKTSIGALSEYVVRSSSAYNGYISDGLYPAHTNPTITINSINNGLTTSGVFCIGVINNQSGATQGAITYYWMSAAQLGALKSYLLSNNFLADNGLSSLTDMSQDLLKCVYNPYQYIVSCKYFPIAKPGILSDTDIKIGWWTLTGYTGEPMVASGYVTNKVAPDIPTPAHPQAAARGSYLNHAPYTERYVYHPLIGTVLLDSNKIDAGDRVILSYSIDGVSGQASARITNTTKGDVVLFATNIQLAVDIPLAQISQDYIDMARTAIDSTGNVISAALHGNIAGAITGAATGVLNTLESSIPVLQSSGGSANLSVFGIQVFCNNVFRNIVNEDNAHRGRPLCEQKTINTLSGYIQCADAHADLSCYDAERSQIIEYMNTGFFYE